MAQMGREWQTLRELVDLHHHSEERYVHPLLAQAIPGGRRPYDEEHRAITVMLDDLQGHLGRLVNDGSVADRPDVGREFYLGVNRFYAEFLAHLDREETQAQRALNELYPPEVLAATLQTIIGGFSPDDLMLFIDIMFPAMILPEAAGLLGSIRLPPEALAPLTERARQALGEARWTQLQARLPVPVR